MPDTGVIIQDLCCQIRNWDRLSEASATHALIGVPWCSVERERAAYDLSVIAPSVRRAQAAGLRVILRILWPLPPWASRWAAVDALGERSTDPTLFLRMGMCPSMWADPAWELVYQLQEVLHREFSPGIEFSPPGAGGGEWTHPTSHYLPGQEARARQLWCFDEWALRNWRLRSRAGQLVDSVLPRTVRQARARSDFYDWYLDGLRERIRRTVARTPGKAWVALIPKPGDYDDLVCAGQPGLDESVSKLDCQIIIHCLFGQGNDDISRAYCYDWMERWKRPAAVGVEGWQGLAVNAQRLARTACSHLLVGGDDLVGEGLEQLRFWTRYWASYRRP